MKVDKLYSQLHNIIENYRFNTKLVLAMGSAYNIKLMQDYLKCYFLKIQAILDNNPKLQGTFVNGCKVYSPEEVLLPKKENVLILVYSPGYGKQIERQLISLGYEKEKHFILIQDFRTPIDNWGYFFDECRNVRRGERIYQSILKKYGKNIHIFISRGATGDVFFNGLYLKEYIKKKKIGSYALVGDAKGLKKIAHLFGIEKVIPLSFDDAEAFQQCYKFLRKPNVTDIFMWQGSLYFNRCQTRMHKEFTFLDTYTHYIYEGLVEREKWNKPVFKTMDMELHNKYQKKGIIKGKTVIVAPFAYSVKKLPEFVWEKIAVGLKNKGYHVFVSINQELEINPFSEMQAIFFPFEESEALLSYAGYFLALRSGLCDIVAMIPCRQVILYPQEMNPIDYNVHRSDKIFSGFETMGYDVSYMTEISSPVIEDIVTVKENICMQSEKDMFYEQLIEQVINEFPICE